MTSSFSTCRRMRRPTARRSSFALIGLIAIASSQALASPTDAEDSPEQKMLDRDIAALGRGIAILNKTFDSIAETAISQDGTTVITLSSSGAARLWDAKTGRPIGGAIQVTANSQSTPAGDRKFQIFSPDGTLFVAVTNASGIYDNEKKAGAAQLWDVKAGTAVGKPMTHDAPIVSVAFSPDGRRIVTASDDMTARIWDGQTGASIAPPIKLTTPLHSAAFNQDGSVILTASGNGACELHEWDGRSGAPLNTPFLNDWRYVDYCVSANFSPDGTIVQSVNMFSVQLFDAKSAAAIGQPINIPEKTTRRSVSDSNFSPDSNRLVVAFWDGTARIWNTRTGDATGLVLHDDSAGECMPFDMTKSTFPDNSKQCDYRINRVVSAVFDRSGARVLFACHNSARFWDAVTGKQLGPAMPVSMNIDGAAVSPDGTRVVTTSGSNIVLWDTADEKYQVRHAVSRN